MRRQEFISQLRQELYGLPANEIDDIIRDHNEMLDDALAAGRAEYEVVKSFGSPRELANSLKAEIKIEQATDQKNLSKQVSGAFGAVGALLVLAPFNLIFVLGPFCAVMGMLVGGWAAAGAIALAALGLLAFFFGKLIFVSAGFAAQSSVFFAFVGGLGVGFLLLLGMYSVTRFFLKLTFSYLKWNLKFITART